MVKLDVRRDYYADLGLQPSAEVEDIKKQFRKLALRYHPDRNPGREQEFNAKFQAIQAANEILSDPQQRLKYDTDRLRAGYGKVYGPPKTTQRKPHPTSFASATPPKAQPQKPPFPTRHTTSSGPSPGAQRYAPHARAGTQQWSKTQDDAQTRADAFRAFNGMRGSHAGGWRPFDPETGRATTSGGAPRQQNAPFSNSRSKSAYEYFKENIKSQGSSSPNSPKKKNGFAPGTVGGDEPMATNTSAYTSNRSERPSSMYFDSAPPPTAKKPAAPDRTLFAENPKRSSTSYATAGGEKTFFSSSGLGNPSSGRTSSGSYKASNTHTDPPNPAPGQSARHRSASPKEGRNRTYSISTSSSDLDQDSDDDVKEVRRPSAFKPKAVPKSRLRAHQKFTDIYGDENSSSATGEESFARKRTRPPPPPENGHWRPRRVSEIIDLTADSDDQKGHNSDSAAFPKGSYKSTSKAQASHPFTQTSSGLKMDGTKPTPFERHSSSDLHKKFSAEEWRDNIHTFDFIGATMAKEKTSPSQQRSSTTHRNDSAPRGSNAPGLNPFASPEAQTQGQPSQQAPTPFAQAKFSADQWAEKLQDISWNAQENDKARQTANTQPSRSPKKQTRPGTKVRSVPQPASVANEAEEAEEAKETINGNVPPEPSRSTPTDAEAMDIDEPPVPPASAPPAPEKAAAGVPGSTIYPDLKAQVPHATTTARKNVEARTPFFDLDNLRNTAPFTSTNNGGIENLEDVHATLPFESGAKQPNTNKREIRPRELQLPNPPKRPKVPQPTPAHPGSTQLILSHIKWNWYISAMGSYMYEWNLFNRRMLLHFNARQEATETGLAPGWISAVGDTSKLRMNGSEDGDTDSPETKDNAEYTESDDLTPGGKGGFSAYLRAIEEDNRVRKHWDVANEMHQECILELGQLRDWIRNGGKVV